MCRLGTLLSTLVLLTAVIGASASCPPVRDDISPQAHLERGIVLSRACVHGAICHGKALLGEGEWNGAIEQFSRTLESAPENFDAYLGLARAFWESGQLSDALPALGRALKLVPNDADARQLLDKLLVP